jgi:hypothetical protein
MKKLFSLLFTGLIATTLCLSSIPLMTFPMTNAVQQPYTDLIGKYKLQDNPKMVFSIEKGVKDLLLSSKEFGQLKLVSSKAKPNVEEFEARSTDVGSLVGNVTINRDKNRKVIGLTYSEGKGGMKMRMNRIVE